MTDASTSPWPLYNASGLWVRPHAMFFGDVLADGRVQPRFAFMGGEPQEPCQAGSAPVTNDRLPTKLVSKMLPKPLTPSGRRIPLIRYCALA